VLNVRAAGHKAAEQAASLVEEASLKDLVVAVGLMLAIEGALYAAVPAIMKRVMRDAMKQSDTIVRWVGFAALVLGVGLVWIIRG
jgi:uncharacterized protein YjeT (DUF2065 family)